MEKEAQESAYDSSIEEYRRTVHEVLGCQLHGFKREIVGDAKFIRLGIEFIWVME